MKRKSTLCIMLLAAAGFAFAKAKHPSLPEVFETAKTVHVEAADARDITDISLDPETRNAILDVQDAIQSWGRYSLSRSRHEADLILVIYKGRLTRDANSVTIPSPPHSTNNPVSAGPIQNPADASQATNGEASPDGSYQERDELKVYTLDANGKLKKLLWRNEQVHGLDPRSLLLVQQLEREIDKAYPNPPATSPSAP
jgi:hypothetical protein